MPPEVRGLDVTPCPVLRTAPLVRSIPLSVPRTVAVLFGRVFNGVTTRLRMNLDLTDAERSEDGFQQVCTGAGVTA
jgi:hypothetical protein